MNYREAIDWLYATQLHGIRLGLENIQRLVEALEIPISGPNAPKFLHVAGTNGKGSVCAMIEAICRAAGRRVGLFTSPHLISFHERIRVGGEMISEADVASGLTEIRDLARGSDHSPTFFEITTALALAHFHRSGAELIVLETGMGGRFDATNVVVPLVAILTSIDLDHQQWLGSTVEEIAREKSGIIKPGVPVVSAPQHQTVERVIRETAERVRAGDLQFVEKPREEGETNLVGSYQLWNAAVAVAATRAAGLDFTNEVIDRGLLHVEWRGRFQQIGERIVLDGAHNPSAATRLAQTWRELFAGEKATLILGMLEDKDMRGIAAALLPIASRVMAVPVRNPRAASADAVGRLVRELAPAMPCESHTELSAAIDSAPAAPERVLIAGSLFLVGEALARFDGTAASQLSAQ